MNKLGWFMCGWFTLGMILLIIFSYLEIGTALDRLTAFVIAIFGMGFAVTGLKDKEKEESA